MAITTVHNELIAVNAISGTLIADNAITATHIATNAVSGTLIADNGITTLHIAANNVTSTSIVANAITSTQLADNAVTATKIPDGTQFTLGTTAFTGNITITDAGPSISLVDSDNNPDYQIKNGNGTLRFIDTTNSTDLLQITTADASFSAHILAKGGHEVRAYRSGDSAYASMFMDTGEKLYIRNSWGTKDLVWAREGYLGIGTASPSSLLTIKNTGSGGTWPFRIFNSQDTDMLAGFYESSSGDGYHGMLYLNDGGGTTDVKLSTNGDSWFNGGNVGIGTASPDEKLVLKGDGARMLIESADYELFSIGRRGSSGSGLDQAYLRMKAAGTNTVLLDTAGDSYFNGGSLHIGSTDSISSSSEKFSVYSSSTGHTKFSNSSDSYGTLYMENTSTTADTFQPSIIIQKGGGNRGYLGVRHTDSVMGMSGNGGISLRTGSAGLQSSTERLAISNTGNISTYPAAGNHFVINEGGVDSDFRVESDGNAHMLFVDGGNNRVGIGTASPGVALHINHATDVATRWSTTSGSTYSFQIGQYYTTWQTLAHPNIWQPIDGSGSSDICITTATNSATAGIVIDAGTGGNVGIGTAAPAEKLHVNGGMTSGQGYPIADNTWDWGHASYRWDDIHATNGTIQTSDRNEKTEIVNSDLGLSFIKSLSPKSFKRQGGTRTHYGLVAQDVETVITGLGKTLNDFAGVIKADISEEKNGSEHRYGLRYDEMLAPVIKAIQELEARLAALE